MLNADGMAIPEVTVKLTQDPDKPGQGRSFETTTDEEGRFSVGIIHAPTKTMPFLLAVRKEGFDPHEERLTGTASYNKDIVLQLVKK